MDALSSESVKKKEEDKEEDEEDVFSHRASPFSRRSNSACVCVCVCVCVYLLRDSFCEIIEGTFFSQNKSGRKKEKRKKEKKEKKWH